MKKYLGITAMILGLSALPLALYAQDEDENGTGDDTMETVEESGKPEMEPLSLPEEASEQGKEHSAAGLETANEARSEGREFGEAQAAEARAAHEEGADHSEMGQETAAEARDNAGRP